MATIPVERGCGRRVHGGIYAECGTAPGGRPIEDFIVDPPVPIARPLAAIGVQLVERAGVWHVLDLIGRAHYPNVADFIEEARRFGASRRLPKTLDFAKLGPESRLLLAHARAILAPSAVAIYRPDGTDPHPCPRGIAAHEMPDGPAPMCAGLWWHDVEGGNRLDGALVDPCDVERLLPSLTYLGRSPALAESLRGYAVGLCLSLPLTNLAVIRGPAGEHEPAIERAKAAGVPLEIVDA